MKQKAEVILKDAADTYLRLLSDRLKNELRMIDEAEATGNWVSASHHRAHADVYTSMLDGDKGGTRNAF